MCGYGAGYTGVRLWRIIPRPRETAREILADPRGLRSAGVFVLLFALAVSLLFLDSHFAGDYPYRGADGEAVIDAWGEFAMLPFVKIAPERYRLAQAIFFTPMVLAAWVLMAGSARLLSALWGGRVRYTQYLSLFAFSFFVFWALATLCDVLYNLLLGDLLPAALRNEHGPLARALVAGFPPVMWTVLLGLGGVYNAIVTHEGEELSVARVVLIGAVTTVWPYALIAFLIR